MTPKEKADELRAKYPEKFYNNNYSGISSGAAMAIEEADAELGSALNGALLTGTIENNADVLFWKEVIKEFSKP